MKAINLFSGGLDSQLAVVLMQQQNIEVLGINFVTPFFGGNERTIQAAKDLGIELITIDISNEYIPGVLNNPVYGYGKNLNPCIDCHGFMLRKAGYYMNQFDASFLITGEVIGQRPMSQNKSALNAVDKLSGYRGFIVRPLSGKLLPPTEPEIRGWIEREGLLDISGRGRVRQMELAKQFAIKDYPSPAGGCLLTEQTFARRLKMLLERNKLPAQYEMEILKVGRHFVLETDKLLVVGRNQSENRKLKELAWPDDWLLNVADRPGPQGLLRYSKDSDPELLQYAAAIVARYSDAKSLDMARVKIYQLGEKNLSILEISPLKPEEIPPAV